MTYDDLNAGDQRSGEGTPGYEPSRPASAARPSELRVPDREVPLPGNGAQSLLHQWLDGEVPAAAMRATPGGNETADVWSRINDEAETLRSRTTPLHVHKRIMDSLPDDAYRTHQPWYRRPFAVQPAVMVAGAAALIGVGMVVARAVFR